MADDYTSQIFNPNSGGMADVVQRAILGQQQQGQNENILAQQQQALDVAKANAEAAAQQRARATAAWQAVHADPSAHNVAQYMLAVPDQAEAFQKGWNLLNAGERESNTRTAVDIKAALDAGKPDVARNIITTRRDADVKAGGDPSHWDTYLKLLDGDPGHSKALANIIVAGALGPDKFAEAYGQMGKEGRDQELQPGIVAKGTAEAAKAGVEAQYAAPKIESDLRNDEAQRKRWDAQTQNEIGQLKLGWAKQNLDADTLETTTALELEKLRESGRAVTGVSLSEMTKSVGAAQSGEMMANQSEDLADKIAGSGARGGMGSSWAEWMKRNTGMQDPVSMLRAQYQQVINQQAIKNLPPGPASDKDIQFARQAFPKPTDPPEYVAKFLKGLAKMQRIAATGDARRADWISANGDIGTAKDDLEVGGVLVPKGTTFIEFNRNQVGVDRKKELPPGIAGLVDKYGGKK
jgi:hypothetical protein